MKGKSRVIITVLFALAMVGAGFLIRMPEPVISAETGETSGAKPAVIRENIFDSEIVSGSVYIMVGDRGKIYRSTDKGGRWMEIPSGSREPLYGITFSDGKNGWVSGASGLILHSADGGRTWTKQNTGSDRHLFDIDFADDRNGVAVGDWGAVLATDDGGATWHDASMAEDVVLYDVAMAEDLAGWIAGEFGGIYKTEDGGKSWRRIYNSGQSFFCLHYDPLTRHLIAAGLDGDIVYSDDLGETWRPAKNDFKLSIYGISQAGSLAMAAGDKGLILRSTDFGKTWDKLEMKNNASLGWFSAVSLALNSEPAGCLVGAGGFFLVIKDKEIQWH